MSHVDAGQEAADDLIITDCEEIHRLYAACQNGIARLAVTEADEPASAESTAAAYWLSRFSLEYEDRALRLQERSAYGSRGLIAKGEQLEALLEYKAASVNDGLLQAVRSYISNVRRMAGALGWHASREQRDSAHRVVQLGSGECNSASSA